MSKLNIVTLATLFIAFVTIAASATAQPVVNAPSLQQAGTSMTVSATGSDPSLSLVIRNDVGKVVYDSALDPDAEPTLQADGSYKITVTVPVPATASGSVWTSEANDNTGAGSADTLIA